jgi:hypothetical protein
MLASFKEACGRTANARAESLKTLCGLRLDVLIIVWQAERGFFRRDALTVGNYGDGSLPSLSG